MWLSILLYLSLFVQPVCSEHGDLSNVSGEARLPADINVFQQPQLCIQDNARVCQETQVGLLLCSLPVPVLINRV